MDESTMWWLSAGAAIVIELTTGTFYLLMIAIGLVAAALAAHAGVSPSLQFVVAAVVGGGAVVGWHLSRSRQPKAHTAGADPDVNMDVGQTVQVDFWNSDGTASVNYRGANWTVVSKAGSVPAPGTHRVIEVVGSRLIVDKM